MCCDVLRDPKVRFTWASRGTDPAWARKEPETLFCPAGVESSPGCTAQQSPKYKNRLTT